MPSKLKKLVHERMAKTGESWQTAERYVRAHAVNPSGAEPPAKTVAEAHPAPPPVKHLHVLLGTSQGTTWALSDDPKGAIMAVPVTEGPFTAQVAADAFYRTVFPVVVETSSDGGKTWVQHHDDAVRPDWRSSIRRLYGLLGLGTGHWAAGRIRARTGEELLRHPPKILSEVIEGLRAAAPSVQVHVHAASDQIIVFGANHAFVVQAHENGSEWPVLAVPPPPAEGSWVCFSIDDVLAALRYPTPVPLLPVVPFENSQPRAPRKGEQTYQRPAEPFDPPAMEIQVVPLFDSNDPAKKTRTIGSAYQDPIRPVAVVNGARRVVLWVTPLPHGQAGWQFQLTHQEGPWPLVPDERAALEDWLEHFATEEWPGRTMLWPAEYRAHRSTVEAAAAWARGAGEDAQRAHGEFRR